MTTATSVEATESEIWMGNSEPCVEDSMRLTGVQRPAHHLSAHLVGDLVGMVRGSWLPRSAESREPGLQCAYRRASTNAGVSPG